MKLTPLFLAAALVASLSAQNRFNGSKFTLSEQPTGKASIEGNAVDAVTREPIKKASVILNGMVSLTATTDASGHFAFHDLPAGKYIIQANSEKYPPPRPGVDVDSQQSVTLAAEDQKQDITLVLAPGAYVRGRVLDEDGNPMPSCSVELMSFQPMDGDRALSTMTAAQSDDHGEYQMSNVQPGKYYVLGRCFQTVPLPHPFIKRQLAAELPLLTYAPQFYPGVSDPTGATRIEASSNAKLIGIDLRMSPAAGVTVKGRVGSLAAGRNLQVAFQSKDSARVDWQHYNVRLNGSTGEFQIPNVPPGSYELIAKSTSNGTTLFAQVSVEVGEKPIEPLQVALDPTATLSGTVSIEGDVKVLMSNWHVQMQPLDRRPIMPQPPQGDVKSDGTFTLNSVVPGRWRLIVNGAPGYLKSMTQGAQEISPFDFEVGLAGGGPLNVVIGTAFAQVDASVTGLPPATDQVACLMWPTNGDPNRTQTQGVNRSAHLSFNLPPGKYYGCAVSDGQPWALLQNRPLRKALESACQVVEITESGRNSVTLPFLSVEDLKRIRDKLEQ